MKIGQSIKERRQALNYTQEQLAEKVQVSRSTISNWETNRNYPDIQMIVDLSNTLDISLDALLKGDKTVVTHIANDTKQRKKQSLKIKILSSFILILTLTLLFFYVAHPKVTGITQPQQILNAHMDASKETIDVYTNLPFYKSLTGYWCNNHQTDSTILEVYLSIANDFSLSNKEHFELKVSVFDLTKITQLNFYDDQYKLIKTIQVRNGVL